MEQVCRWWCILRFQILKAGPVSLSIPAACWSSYQTPGSSPTLCHDENGRKVWTVSQPQLEAHLYKSCQDLVSLCCNGSWLREFLTLYNVWSWVHIFVAMCNRRKFLGWWLNKALIYEQRRSSLGVILSQLFLCII